MDSEDTGVEDWLLDIRDAALKVVCLYRPLLFQPFAQHRRNLSRPLCSTCPFLSNVDEVPMTCLMS